jgi:hypothetical protein
MTVNITESLTLNGVEQGGNTSQSITGITEISKRTVVVTQTESTIATFSAAVAAGNYIAADVRYIRFTNLEASGGNFITLTFRNQDNDEVAIKLDAGQSFVWNGDNSNGMTAVFNATEDADAASSTNFGSLTNIQADADTGSCSLEMLIAGT